MRSAVSRIHEPIGRRRRRGCTVAVAVAIIIVVVGSIAGSDTAVSGTPALAPFAQSHNAEWK